MGHVSDEVTRLASQCFIAMLSRHNVVLDSASVTADDTDMNIRGRVHNGVVVLEEGETLPEGAEVRVSYSGDPVIHVSPVRKRVQLPLVKTGKPGSVSLTNDRIAEILNEQDAPS